MIMTLYRKLDRTRVQFDFLEFTEGVSDFAPEIADLGGRIIKYDWRFHRKNPLRGIQRLAALLKREGPFQAVHSHILFASGTVMISARTAGVPVRITHSHNTSDIVSPSLPRRLYHSVARAAIDRHATHFVACGEAAARYLFSPRRNVTIIPNTVDTSTYYPASSGDARAMREALGFPRSGLLLISVARLERVKNHEFMIKLAEVLATRQLQFRMLFAGAGSLASEIRRSIDAKKLHGHVELLGPRADVADLLKASDVLIMPSLFEGLPVVLVEAQASGLPCLVSSTVTQEADLGLGLLKYLSIDRVHDWVDALEQIDTSRLPASSIESHLEQRGYSTVGALAQLLALYMPNAEAQIVEGNGD